MIKEALTFLTDEVNKYLSVKLGSTTDPRLVLGNIARINDGDTGTSTNSLTNKIVLSLVNMEEDRVSKSPENYIKQDDKVIYKNPKIFLNLYVLFSVNRTDYPDALKWLSLVIQQFQYQYVFSNKSHPSLDTKIDRMVVDMHTLNMEQLNHLWGVLGGKYLPSVLYKVRVVTIEEDTADSSGSFIQKIAVNATTVS